MVQELKRTALYQTHISLKARMVPFAGWEMPVQYSGILDETRTLRSGSGIFDVSHMGRLYVSGSEAHLLMDWILTASASDLRLGRARYAMICDEDGGIIDDTVFYRLGEDYYLLVCNASNRPHVLPWMQRWVQEKFPAVTIEDRTETTGMIAFQGPSTAELLDGLCDANPSAARPFSALEGRVGAAPVLIGRTGYTGEDGFELIVDSEHATGVWDSLMGEGAVPCGLGARDVLRLEAGLPLHGNDIDTSTTPLEAGLGRFVRLEKEFAGAEALRRQKEAGLKRTLVGLAVEGRSIARKGYPIIAEGTQIGGVTSGTYSPTLDRNIAMGYVLVGFGGPGERLQVDIRGKLTEARVVPLPFYSRGAVR